MVGHKSPIVLLFAMGLASAALIGCGDDEPSPPEGVDCNEIISAGDDGATMNQALGQASSGDCVVATGALYQGSFVVKSGVKLVAAKGASPKLQGQGDGATVELQPSSDTLLQGFSVEGGGIGVLIKGSEGTVKDVTV